MNESNHRMNLIIIISCNLIKVAIINSGPSLLETTRTMDTDLTTKLLGDTEEHPSADPLFIGDIDATTRRGDEPIAIQVDDQDAADDENDEGDNKKAPAPELPDLILDPQEVFDGQDYTRGERQPNACRDFPFAFLWYVQLIAIVVLAVKWGIPALAPHHHHHEDDDKHDSTDDDDTYSYTGLVYFTLVSGASSALLSGVTMAVFAHFGRYLIQLSLLFSVFASFGMAVLAAIEGNVVLAVLSLVGFLVGCCYYFAVSERIPFAAANLSAGVTAVRNNGGVVLIAYFCVLLVFVFSTVWTLALIGVADKSTSCSDGDSDCNNSMNEGLVFALLVSLFWSQQVISNVVHATVAGVVGTWWFANEEASSFCSPAVAESFLRSTTTSFGSICFGSLLTAIIKALRQMVQSARNDDRRSDGNGILLCLAECVLACLEGIMQYFNKYAFIYCSLYGYDYLTAGRNVLSLFNARGWTVIINDDMVQNCLLLSCLVLSCLSGCAGMLICFIQGGSWLDALIASDDDAPNTFVAAFLIAFILGLIISSILMGVIDSAVSTAIVCFAESPSDLHTNHPELYEEMVSAWRNVYPNDCGF
jgi:hypothetical protein